MKKTTLTIILLILIATALPLVASQNEIDEIIGTSANDYVAPYEVNQGNFFPWGHDFLTLFVIFILLIAIDLFVLPDEAKRTVHKFVAAYGIYIIFFVIWLVFRKRWGRIYEVPGRWPAMHYWVTFILAFILLLYWLVLYFFYKQRYLTYHAIANNRSGSCAYYTNKGDWTIFKIGTSGRTDKKIVIPNPVPQEIWVVPRCAWRKLGGQFIIESQIIRKDELDMPPEVREAIEEDPLASMKKGNIYFGLWSQKIRAEDPRYDELENKLTKAHDRINELQDMLKGKLKNVKGFISDTMAMQDKMRNKEFKQSRVQQEYGE
jgi:uncharacterized membrane protein